MKESIERVIGVGFSKRPKSIFDEIERISAEMLRAGWELNDSCVEDSLGNIHLIFTREINIKEEN